MKIKNHLLGMMAIASLLVRRNSHPKFQTSVDVVEGVVKSSSLNVPYDTVAPKRKGDALL